MGVVEGKGVAVLYEALQVIQSVLVQYILYLLVDEVVIEEELIVVLKHTQAQCNLDKYSLL